MSSVNRVILVGNLGHDPDLRMAGDHPVCNLSIATNETFKGRDGQRQERTEWHRVQVWGTMAEACSKHLTKGRQVYLEGRLTTRKWTGRDGAEKSGTEIVAERVVFLGGTGGESPAGRTKHRTERAPEQSWAATGDAGTPSTPGAPLPGDEDIPF